MDSSNTVVGLDVHKKTVVAAVLPLGSDNVTETVTIENFPKAVEKLVNRIAVRGPVEFVYEAGPCGYEIQRQLAAGAVGRRESAHDARTKIEADPDESQSCVPERLTASNTRISV